MNDALESCGCFGGNGFGYSPIKTEGGRFDLSDDFRSPLAMIVADDQTAPYDAVAFHWRQPGQWWLLTGEAEILGARELCLDAADHGSLALYETPLSWLRRRRTGVCIVNWALDPRQWFDALPVLVCETAAIEARLRERLDECQRPRFQIRSAVRHAA